MLRPGSPDDGKTITNAIVQPRFVSGCNLLAESPCTSESSRDPRCSLQSVFETGLSFTYEWTVTKFIL